MPTDHADDASGRDPLIQLGVSDGELAEAAAALDDAFADYPLDLSFTADSLRAMFAAEDVLPEACALAGGRDGKVVGVGLAALRGERGRIAAMGVRRDAHRSGVGLTVGRAVLDALAGAGAREVILEALTVNAPALALYEGELGFTRRRRLVGFAREPGGEPIAPSRWEEALAPGMEPDSWQLPRVVAGAREQTPSPRCCEPPASTRRRSTSTS
jgi:ribosomal protein S18 acetylase RimI-like enzyme